MKNFNMLKKNGVGLLIAFIVLFVALSIASEHFFTLDNLMTVLRQAVFVAIVAFGMTFVIATGGIDLSVGAVMAIAGIAAAAMLANGVNTFFAIAIAVILAALIGSLTGLSISKCGIPDFIATMAMMSIIRGIVQVYTGGSPTYGLNSSAYPSFAFLAHGYLGPIPFPVIIAVIVFAVCFYLLNKTSLGRYIVSVGSNRESARLVGINVSRIKLTVYVISGALAGFAGVLMTSRLTAAMPDAGLGYEMDAIAATVIGGTSLSGGKASLAGTALGAVLMAIVRNGLNILNVNTFWHQVVIGGIVLLAVGVDVLSSKFFRGTQKE